MSQSAAGTGFSNEAIREALRAIIEGRRVKRARHDLVHDGMDLSGMFIEELMLNGYLPTTVADVDAQAGQRVPAFLVEDRVAYFGWVFWEQFTSWKLRKLWGSVLKDVRGDWKIQIPASRASIIYANERGRLDMDIDHPPDI